MTSEMKNELKHLLQLCPIAKEIYARGEFSELKTEPYVYIFVDTNDMNIIGEYMIVITDYLSDKYDTWEKHPGIRAYIFNRISGISMKAGIEGDKVYEDGRWLI